MLSEVPQSTIDATIESTTREIMREDELAPPSGPSSSSEPPLSRDEISEMDDIVDSPSEDLRREESSREDLRAFGGGGFLVNLLPGGAGGGGGLPPGPQSVPISTRTLDMTTAPSECG